jgi:hypothetical protein
MGIRGRLGGLLGGSAPQNPLARHLAVAEPYLARIPVPRKQGERVFSVDGSLLLNPQRSGWFRTVEAASPTHQLSIGIALLEAMAERRGGAMCAFVAPELLKALGRSVPHHDAADRALASRLAAKGIVACRAVRPAQYAAAVIERSLNTGTPVEEVEGEIRRLVDALSSGDLPASYVSPLRAGLLRLVGERLDERALFDAGDTWGAAMQAYLRAAPDAGTLGPLMTHLQEATAVKPSARWVADAMPLLQSAGAEALVRHMIDASFESRLTRGHGMQILDASPFQPANSAIVRGGYWAAFAGRWPWVAETLSRAGLHWALSGRNDNYTRDQKLASTCATLLGELGTPEALAGLGRINAKVRNRTLAKTVATSLEKAAARAGTSPSELLELAVPRHGLGADGRREIPLGPGVAILALEGDGDASLRWRVGDGRTTDSVPKAIAVADKAGVTAAKAGLKDLRKALGVERARIEDLLVEDREWPIATWAERYLAHPVTASFARRLVWRFESGGAWTSGMALDDGMVTADGAPLAHDAEARVRLWHPIDVPADEVHAWRTFLLDRRVRQPFKQAFREVYLLAPAEEQTETYSNRFAAHVLDYAVARALMGARRWATNFLGPFDGGFEGTAKREFRSRGLRAEFYHDAIEPDADDRWAAVEHCATDQVRFYRMADRNGDPVPLREIPPVVFSEAMRDVDLFVSVSSIAADVNWADGGRERGERYERYWQAQAFGDLGPTAEGRREVLAWMLPQLAIADRLRLDDRWLRVRGDLRSYKIHLGSANIVMEPDDQYLCIVPARAKGGSGGVFLPFEDDHRLSVILSKAVLLANDRKITDPTITRQLGRR